MTDRLARLLAAAARREAERDDPPFVMPQVHPDWYQEQTPPEDLEAAIRADEVIRADSDNAV